MRGFKLRISAVAFGVAVLGLASGALARQGRDQVRTGLAGGGRWIRTFGSAMRTANSAALVMPPDLSDFRAISGRIPSHPALEAPRNRRIAPEPRNGPDLRGVLRYYRQAKILNEAGR